jgi:hypothetical protein
LLVFVGYLAPETGELPRIELIPLNFNRRKLHGRTLCPQLGSDTDNRGNGWHARPAIMKFDPRKCQLCGITAFLLCDILQFIKKLNLILEVVSLEAEIACDGPLVESFNLFNVPVSILGTKVV